LVSGIARDPLDAGDQRHVCVADEKVARVLQSRAANLGPQICQPMEMYMDKDRIEGSMKQAKGAIKEAVGKVLGDAKLSAEGKADRADGKIQNAIGSLKDTLTKKLAHTVTAMDGYFQSRMMQFTATADKRGLAGCTAANGVCCEGRTSCDGGTMNVLVATRIFELRGVYMRNLGEVLGFRTCQRLPIAGCKFGALTNKSA
jgi:uncharacterized protein YjbJ (UPF0337 family)